MQQNTKVPFRFLGLHWAEPFHTTRFLEIICGDQSNIEYAEWLCELSHQWGKEPTLAQGFYDYTPEEAELWQKTFEKFSYEIRELALGYPPDVVKKQLKKEGNHE